MCVCVCVCVCVCGVRCSGGSGDRAILSSLSLLKQ